MRRLAWALVALLPGAVLAAEPVDTVAAQTKICDDMDDDAGVWVAACMTAIQSGRFSDPARLSDLYSNLGFADINLALQTDHNFDKALADLNEGVRLNPDNMFAINNRANAYMYRGEYDASLADIAEVLRKNPDAAKAHGLRCVVLTKMKRAGEGLPECIRALVLGETKSWIFEHIGAAYEGLGDLHNAELAYRQALDRDPKSQDALDGLARATKTP